MNDVIKKAIAKYGKKHQTFIFFEEVAELQKEISKNLRGEKNREELAEEYADVTIMLEQIKVMYQIKDADIMRYRQMKLDRLRKRIRGD